MGLQSKRNRKNSKFKFQSIFIIIWCECDSLYLVEKKKVISHNLPHKIDVKMSVELVMIIKLLKRNMHNLVELKQFLYKHTLAYTLWHKSVRACQYSCTKTLNLTR